jgi:hypothetical protein
VKFHKKRIMEKEMLVRDDDRLHEMIGSLSKSASNQTLIQSTFKDKFQRLNKELHTDRNRITYM